MLYVLSLAAVFVRRSTSCKFLLQPAKSERFAVNFVMDFLAREIPLRRA
jgi:hypothetical protein